jgi:hypothetical protein
LISRILKNRRGIDFVRVRLVPYAPRLARQYATVEKPVYCNRPPRPYRIRHGRRKLKDFVRAALNLGDAARFVIDGEPFGHAELTAALVEFAVANRALSVAGAEGTVGAKRDAAEPVIAERGPLVR